MKFIDKMILCVFSVIILLFAVLSCFFIFGWADVTTLYVMMTNILGDQTTCNILIGVNVVLILLAIKGIFFESGDKDSDKYSNGILLENDDGKLLITRETLTNIVNSVVSGFESVKSQQTKIILDENNNLSVILTIEVSDNAIIKELSNNIQIRVKDSIKKSLDIEVKSLDIRIKNVVAPQETKEN